jgi:hypothetical protein
MITSRGVIGGAKLVKTGCTVTARPIVEFAARAAEVRLLHLSLYLEGTIVVLVLHRIEAVARAHRVISWESCPLRPARTGQRAKVRTTW